MAAPSAHRYRCPVEDLIFTHYGDFEKHIEEIHPPARLEDFFRVPASKMPPKKVSRTRDRHGEPYTADEVARLFQHWDRKRSGTEQAKELAKAGLFPGRTWQSIQGAAYRWILKSAEPTPPELPPEPAWPSTPSTGELYEKPLERVRFKEPATPRPHSVPKPEGPMPGNVIVSRLESIMQVMQVPEESRKFVLSYVRETPTAQNPWALYDLLAKVRGIRSTTAQLITNYVFGSEVIPISGSPLIREPVPTDPTVSRLPKDAEEKAIVSRLPKDAEEKAIEEAVTQITTVARTAARIRSVADAVAKILAAPQRSFFGPEEAKLLGTEMGKAAGSSFKDVLEDVRKALARIEARTVPGEPKTKVPIEGPKIKTSHRWAPWSPEEIGHLREVTNLVNPNKKAEARRLVSQFPGRSWEAILKAIRRYVLARPPRKPWYPEDLKRLIKEWNRQAPAWDEARRLFASGQFAGRTAKAIYEMAFKRGLPTGAFDAQKRVEETDAQLRRELEVDRELKKKD